MKENLENKIKYLNDIFSEPESNEEIAWNIIHDFYHIIITTMEKKNIKRTQLANKLDVSRAAISQMFNHTPNVSILKMVKLAAAVGLEMELDINTSKMYFKDKEQPYRELEGFDDDTTLGTETIQNVKIIQLVRPHRVKSDDSPSYPPEHEKLQNIAYA